MKAAQLNLRGHALAGAMALEAQFPAIAFTSGRRAVADQARAMASNLVQKRRWIADTYTNTVESRELQAWVDRNPNARGRDQLAAGLARIMAAWPDEGRARLSKHFSGDAFDVQPIDGPAGAAIVAAIRKLPGLDKFLEREGGLVRWHAQFR
ncbi:hypothetical protein BH11PSE1_BH11PSE1_16400 [soil metagenome]